ncbi:hypothetical protein H6F86_16595 [Phormidium sp. FACHB-592]|uniref:Uncharacterized protein n=1 Tax=Stenomitos frigidus AS-A4 TaxID=2933935 RepID=A0ABV0KP90_9CYAN|nr:hypothetical protein [Phormidium sp. FACHB-592]MBD2075485.1 hypothetical protein [Phormidium sp. FACHB-592]
MKQETLAKLQSADDPAEWESPVDFDWHEAMSRVRRLKPEIEQLTGRPFEIDENVQDASFFTELSLHKPGGKLNFIETVLAIRFSAFGNLFAVWNRSSEQFPPSVVEQVIKTTEHYGFIYVNADELDEQYTGQHEGFKTQSWWIRFFDYI